MTSDGVNSYAYDFQGRPLTVNSTSFIYDAFGRVAEEDSTGSVTHVLYQPDGSRFATIQNGSIQNYFMPMVNGMVEVFNSSGEQYIRHADWLGSSRLATDGNGNAVYSVAHAPYGETYAEKGTLSRFFTGQTQDVIQGPTGIYDFLFREYTAGGGRWMVPDPAGLAAVDPTNPQTWNRYAYVGNNPLSNVDPLGLCVDNGGSPTSTGLDADGNQTFTYSTNNGACQDGDRAQPPPKADALYFGNIGAGSGRVGKLSPNFFKNGNWKCTKAVHGALQCTGSAGGNDDVPIYGIFGWGQGVLSHPSLQTAVSLVRDPDYVSLSGSIGYWSGSVQYVPSSGSWYVTPLAGGLGTPGLSLTAGYLNGAGVNPDVFVSQWGGSGCAFAGAGGCQTYSPGAGWATEVGFGIPSIGASGGYTLRFNPSSQPWLH